MDPSNVKLCVDRYNTERMFDEAVDGYLSAWKFVPDGFFITDKKVRKLFADQVGILKVDLDKINLDSVDFYEDDPRTIIHVRRLV